VEAVCRPEPNNGSTLEMLMFKVSEIIVVWGEIFIQWGCEIARMMKQGK
jgi:hypothetical protein